MLKEQMIKEQKLNEQRKNARYESLARITIEQLINEEFILKDISVTGCRLECPLGSKITAKKRYMLHLIPENASKIAGFSFEVESKWMRSCGSSNEVGFNITESPKGKEFQSYVDYLSWRYSKGSSMTGNGVNQI
jgi:hypothetical protein